MSDTLFSHPHTPGWHQVSRPYSGSTCTRVKRPFPIWSCHQLLIQSFINASSAVCICSIQSSPNNIGRTSIEKKPSRDCKYPRIPFHCTPDIPPTIPLGQSGRTNIDHTTIHQSHHRAIRRKTILSNKLKGQQYPQPISWQRWSCSTRSQFILRSCCFSTTIVRIYPCTWCSNWVPNIADCVTVLLVLSAIDQIETKTSSSSSLTIIMTLQ